MYIHLRTLLSLSSISFLRDMLHALSVRLYTENLRNLASMSVAAHSKHVQ